MAKSLGLEVPASASQLLLALCWSLKSDQQSGNDHDENANDNKFFQVISPAQPM
jgi:hypothetical protein